MLGNALLLVCLVTGSSQAFQPWECPTELLEEERVDCTAGEPISEPACIAKGCTWCSTYVTGYPPCFYNTKPGFDGNCPSTIPPNQRVDCWPYPDASNAKCVDTGCVWCPLDGYSWCFYDDNVVPPPSQIPSKPPDVTKIPTVVPGCPSTIPPYERVDCHPESRASKDGCENKGCYWCEHSDAAVPWCSYPNRNNPDPGDPGNPDNPGGCPSTIPEPNRVDCFPGGGATQDGCEARECIWCESSTDGTPWCFFNLTGEGSDPAKDIYRVDCAPNGGFDSSTCLNRGCNFMGTSVPGAPICYFPENRGYKMIAQVETSIGYQITLQKEGTYTLFGGDVETLTLDVMFETNDRLHVKFTDATQSRFEVPLETPIATSKATNPNYEFVFTNKPIFNFNVTRKDTGTVIIDTSLGGFVYEDQFLQFTTKLAPGSEMYGFGEHEHHSLQHDITTWQTMGMYSRDQPPAANGNLYGVYPMWMVIEDGKNTHGMLILNAAAQDVTLSPAPYLGYRTIGGILDIYIFLGPTPENVVSQYTAVVGRPFIPPYWALGFQLCRYGYGSLATVQETVDRMRAYNIPYDIQYGDIDYMDEQRDFTYDPVTYKGLPEYVDTIKSYGMHYIIILDPCIGIVTDGSYEAFNTGEAMDVWIKNSDCSTSATGKVWPPEVIYFPDYTKPITQTWWTDECVKFHNIIDFDGLWIDMNEPANFVTGSTEGCVTNKWNNPPYFPKIWGNVLADKSMCPDACQHLGNHYDLHSLYGYTQSIQTLPAAQAATGKRSIVISRSTFPGTGKYAGHWLGDNYSQWSNLYYSIIGSLEFNIFGIPYIGADICGFNGDANADMCQRWMQLGAFYTFSRNHNGINYKEQDPAAFGDEVARVSRETLLIRYTLLPYLYTLFYHAHVDGHTVMRPMFHEFIEDSYTHTVDRQLLWGPAFLITPVLDEGMTEVEGYFPDARWYDYYTGVELGVRKATVKLDAPMDYIPLHVRGGYVLPTQEPDVTTTISRKNPVGLIVALDEQKSARGDLFWDDGDSTDTYETGNHYYAEFTASATSLKGFVTNNGYSGANSLAWGTVRVFGASASWVKVNGFSHNDFSRSTPGVLEIYNIKTVITGPLDITWG